MLSRSFTAVALLLLGVFSVFGQGLSSLTGVVTDPTGAVIPGATITIIHTQTGAQRDTKSDGDGRYNIPQVQPGLYKLTAKATGFADTVVNDVRLAVDSPANVAVVFEKVGPTATTVSVEASAQQINTQDATLGNAIESQAITQIPFFARNVAGLLAFQPGVTSVSSDVTDSRNGSVNGGKSDQANITLDGVDVNDQQNKYAFTSVLRVTLDSVQEFRTTTSGANADQGRSSGAQISLITKSGTNNLHGSLYEYRRGSETAANGFFENASGVARPVLLINVFGGSIGGPIKKNKIFFFGNYEGRRDASSTSLLRTVPSALLRQGIIQYRTTAGTLKAMTPDELKAVDPLHIGANPASLAVFNQYPAGNDTTVGDGLNTLGYRFTAPQHARQNTYIAKFDYAMNDKNTFFIRGQMQNDHTDGVPQFTGQQPQSVALTNNKGLAVGWTSVLRPTLVSTFRFGYTRQSDEQTGIQNAPATTFRNITPIQALTTGLSRQLPVEHISEDFAWTKGAHDIRFGATLRWIGNQRANYANTYSAATTNVSWLLRTGSDIQPADLLSTFRTAYGDAAMATLGIISQGTANYKYNIDGSVQAQGTPVLRNFGSEEYEWYVQDTWKVKRNLTITAGLRHSLMPPIYEKNGIQTSQNVSLGDWFYQRANLAANGAPQSLAPKIQYILAKDGRPLYDNHLKNFAPRLSLAYVPEGRSGLSKFLFGEGKTSIRAGAGMFYDLFGQSLIRSFDASAFGFSTSITNPSSSQSSLTAPRFQGFNVLPASLIAAAPKGGFPTVQPDNFAITNSIDDRLKPPYTTNLNLSIGREFAGGWFIQGSYVGRLSHRSLVNRDLAMPTNLVDTASGTTYFQAAQILAKQALAGVKTANVAKVPFWENLWPGAAGGGLTATQAIYEEFAGNSPDFTSALYDFDVACSPSCSKFGKNAIFNSQFSALSAWSSEGKGSYHSMQWSVRKRFKAGLVADFNYTYGKSIDYSSSAERAGSFAGFMVNPWIPSQRKGVSDYDQTQIWNAFAFWEIPVGRQKKFGAGMNKITDAFIGGWQLAPSWSQGTELPLSVGNGRNWPTNWNITGFATQVGPVPTPTRSENAPAVAGSPGPNIFADPKAALAAYGFTLPGETGQRNGIRGDGTFVINLGLYKQFLMPYNENHKLQFRWETYNLTNSVRFDVNSATLDLGNTGSFGKYSATLSSPRQMQFALRYEF